MKHVLRVLVCLLISGLCIFAPVPAKRGFPLNAHAQAAPGGAFTTVVWDFDFSAWPACLGPSPAPTKNCVQSFTWKTLSQSSGAVIGIPSVIVANIGTPNLPGTVMTLTNPYAYPAAIGNYNICVWVTFLDGNGAPLVYAGSSCFSYIVPNGLSTLLNPRGQ